MGRIAMIHKLSEKKSKYQMNMSKDGGSLYCGVFYRKNLEQDSHLVSCLPVGVTNGTPLLLLVSALFSQSVFDERITTIYPFSFTFIRDVVLDESP